MSTNYVVARLSGIVSYTDGSHEQFAVHLDHRGNLSYNDKTMSAAAIKENYNQSDGWLAAMFALAGSGADPDITFSAGSLSTPKTINSLVAELSGRVSITPTTVFSKTWEDFIFQYDSNKSDTGTFGAMKPTGNTAAGDGGTSAWNKAATDFADQLNAMFAGLGIHV